MTSAPVTTASSEAEVVGDGAASPLHDLDTLVVGDLVFEIAPPSDRKTIEIIVERDASLVLKAPSAATVDRAEQFVIAKRPWVYRKLADKDALTGPPIVKQFVAGEGFAYLGRSYRLSLTRPGDSSGVRLERGRFHLSASDVSRGAELMRRWYTEVGGRWLQRRIRPWASRLGESEVAVEVRDLGYRWGSARPSTDTQRINMHWATLQLRPSLIDYILVHELAHLHETNHTPEFWSIVARLMPSYEQQIATLSATGKTIWLGTAAPQQPQSGGREIMPSSAAVEASTGYF
ncbi:MAG: M48 family metallopeptidase [Acidimicrobiaceae bacterium]|nr:M48 family metallopeptidase [Acidimicrobiaceae bacterium]MYC40949.1 M48 family metallopeptidase [Acidimicrobiaceae bacterium]MYH88620.1 M48 family metallopeptidase [Acidimicrobiaceae bacterium]